MTTKANDQTKSINNLLLINQTNESSEQKFRNHGITNLKRGSTMSLNFGSVQSTQPSQIKSQRLNQQTQKQKYLSQVEGLRNVQSQASIKIFETPSYTLKDKTIQKLVENDEIQNKLHKMKFNYAESQLFNPQYNFKKKDLANMDKIDILRSLAQQENIINIMHVANNYNRKIPTTSLNLKFSSAQQYFSFDDPKEKEGIMKLYNMRARVKEKSKVSMKNESLSGIFLAKIKGKRPSQPRLQDYDDAPMYQSQLNQTHKKQQDISKQFSATTNQALIDLKISQRESEMPRNLVTNSIMSLQRKEFLEKTLFVKKNIKNELKENAEKLKRKLDNIYFENEDTIQNSPLFKMQKAINKQNTLTPEQKLGLLFGSMKKKTVTIAKKSELDELLIQISPKQDSFDYEGENVQEFKEQPEIIARSMNGLMKRSTFCNSVVDMLDNDQNMDRLVTKYFGNKDNYQQVTVQEDSKESIDKEGENGNGEIIKQQPHYESESKDNSFVQKLDKINDRYKSSELLNRPFSMSQYFQRRDQDAIDNMNNMLNDSAEEEFNKIRKKPKNELQQGLIVKEKALPSHTLIRRKALSIMKYNYQN
ncbi:UNKNOWN [Stylonychia lemnae]|uniref:Uncharacterized protein n=1 Tax=Stylonychia lemnae TaxID=5949 RepID=A0A078B394_STYLE|nr:UNKNOWN [Stylonychia lemnae]|eukprot:CDW87968.1 UNKNOWN [Stylonychia lemnae]